MKPTPMAGSTASNGNTDMDVDESDGMAELSKDMHIGIFFFFFVLGVLNHRRSP